MKKNVQECDANAVPQSFLAWLIKKSHSFYNEWDDKIKS